MKRKLFWLFALSIAAVDTFFLSPSRASSLKLVHNTTGFVVMEFQGNKTTCKDRFLEKDMKLRGIAIPPPLRKAFKGKSVVHFEDKEFPRAFKEIYCKYILNPGDYHWER